MKVIIPARLERKLMAYVHAVDGEIAGMGEVEMREDGNIWVTDLAIYEQEVTGGTADLSSEALAGFMTELVKKGKSPKGWYLWWHSHSNMGAFFSTIDTGTIDRSSEFDHILSLVVNKKGERKCRLDTHRPFRLTADNLTVEVQPEVTARSLEIDDQIVELIRQAQELEKEKNAIETEEPEGIAEEVKDKVREKKWDRTNYLPARAGASRHSGRDPILDLEYDESWSNKRKKDGPVTTKGGIELDSLGKDELEILIEQTTTMIKAHVANGNGDTVECEELRADLSAYYNQYVDTIVEGVTSDRQGYWEGDEWVLGEPAGEEHTLPPAPAPRRMGYKQEEEHDY